MRTPDQHLLPPSLSHLQKALAICSFPLILLAWPSKFLLIFTQKQIPQCERVGITLCAKSASYNIGTICCIRSGIYSESRKAVTLRAARLDPGSQVGVGAPMSDSLSRLVCLCVCLNLKDALACTKK